MIAKTLKENINETKPKANETSVSVPTDKTQLEDVIEYVSDASTYLNVFNLLDIFKRIYGNPFDIDDDEEDDD